MKEKSFFSRGLKYQNKTLFLNLFFILTFDPTRKVQGITNLKNIPSLHHDCRLIELIDIKIYSLCV